MDQSTQQNAAMVEETSAAARNLWGEVASLAERASKFNIGEEYAATASLVKAGQKAAPAASKATVKALETRAMTPAKPAEAKPASDYQSPVKPLPSPAANGAAADEDWTSF